MISIKRILYFIILFLSIMLNKLNIHRKGPTSITLYSIGKFSNRLLCSMKKPYLPLRLNIAENSI